MSEFETLLLAYLDDDLDPDQDLQLQHILRENPDHRRAFFDAISTSHLLRVDAEQKRNGEARQIYQILQHCLNKSAAPKQTQRKTRRHQRRTTKTRRRTHNMFIMVSSIAALLLAAFYLLITLNTQVPVETNRTAEMTEQGQPTQVLRTAQWLQLSNASIERNQQQVRFSKNMRAHSGDRLITENENAHAVLRLDDGSELHISNASVGSIQSLSTDFIFSLEQGTAQAQVSKQKPDHGFHIHTRQSEVHVVGTSFAVKADESFTDVSVQSGIVHVHDKRQRPLRALSANQRLRIDGDGHTYTAHNFLALAKRFGAFSDTSNETTHSITVAVHPQPAAKDWNGLGFYTAEPLTLGPKPIMLEADVDVINPESNYIISLAISKELPEENDHEGQASFYQRLELTANQTTKPPMKRALISSQFGNSEKRQQGASFPFDITQTQRLRISVDKDHLQASLNGQDLGKRPLFVQLDRCHFAIRCASKLHNRDLMCSWKHIQLWIPTD